MTSFGTDLMCLSSPPATIRTSDDDELLRLAADLLAFLPLDQPNRVRPPLLSTGDTLQSAAGTAPSPLLPLDGDCCIIVDSCSLFGLSPARSRPSLVRQLANRRRRPGGSVDVSATPASVAERIDGDGERRCCGNRWLPIDADEPTGTTDEVAPFVAEIKRPGAALPDAVSIVSFKVPFDLVLSLNERRTNMVDESSQLF